MKAMDTALGASRAIFCMLKSGMEKVGVMEGNAENIAMPFARASTNSPTPMPTARAMR